MECGEGFTTLQVGNRVTTEEKKRKNKEGGRERMEEERGREGGWCRERRMVGWWEGGGEEQVELKQSPSRVTSVARVSIHINHAATEPGWREERGERREERWSVERV